MRQVRQRDQRRAPTRGPRHEAAGRALRAHLMPIRACRTSTIPSTIARSWSPPAAASACTARRSTSRPCSPVRGSASRRWTMAFGSKASCTTIWAISISSRELPNHRQPDRHEVVTHVLGPFCYLCLRAGQRDIGAGEGNRTLDTQLGKLMFYH